VSTLWGVVHETRVADQYQEDLPPVRPVVRRFRVHISRCTHCHRRVQGRHPWQTSDALGAAAVQLGPDAVAFAVTLNKQFGVSFGKIATLFHQRLGLTLTRGAIVRALHRTARQAAPTDEALCQTVRGSPMVSPDETAWRVNGRLHWLWAFPTPDTTVYAIRKGRGFPEAASILGADFNGVLVRDGWAPYRQFTHGRASDLSGTVCRPPDYANPGGPRPSGGRTSRDGVGITLPCHLLSGGFRLKLTSRFNNLRLPTTYRTDMISRTQNRTVGNVGRGSSGARRRSICRNVNATADSTTW
jgi:hypothetical protein